MSDEFPDIADPQIAARLGSELATDVLQCVLPALMCVPVTARLTFFQMYLATLVGGINTALGEELTRATLENLEAVQRGDPAEPHSRLH